jgi:hypothetical protein
MLKVWDENFMYYMCYQVWDEKNMQYVINLDLGREKHAIVDLYVTKDEKGDIFSRYWSKSVIRNIRTARRAHL